MTRRWRSQNIGRFHEAAVKCPVHGWVTIEDEASPLNQRVAQSLDIIEANAANAAPTVILVHPNDTGRRSNTPSTAAGNPGYEP